MMLRPNLNGFVFRQCRWCASTHHCGASHILHRFVPFFHPLPHGNPVAPAKFAITRILSSYASFIAGLRNTFPRCHARWPSAGRSSELDGTMIFRP